MRKFIFVLLSWTLAGTCHADAGKTLGDVLDAGAVKLSRQDVEARVIGAWFEFAGRSGIVFQFRPGQDGGVSGHVQGFKNSTPIKGTWKFDESDKLCLDFRGERYGEFQRCHFWFGGPGSFWTSPSESDRQAVVLEMKPLAQ